MKKLVLLTLAFGTLVTSSLFAQSSASSSTLFSVGLEAGIPTGDISSSSSVLFGGSGKIELPLASDFKFTVTAGYTSLYYKSVNFLGYSVKPDPTGIIPLKAGGKYYFNPNFYGEGEVGAAFFVKNGSTTAFAYSPGIGVSYPISPSGAAIDAGVRYEGWTRDGGTIGQIAFRVAYKFKL